MARLKAEGCQCQSAGGNAEMGGTEPLKLRPSLCCLPSTQPHMPYYMKTWRHPQNWKYIIYYIVVSGGPSLATDKHVQKFLWSWDMCFLRKTDRQTGMLIAVLHTPPGERSKYRVQHSTKKLKAYHTVILKI